MSLVLWSRAITLGTALAAWLVWMDTAHSQLPVAEEREKSDMVWQSDLGNGFYKNPVLYADYSDPDVVAVGDDFYMTASSFNSAPGLPVLHSRDLVNWTLLGHALTRQVPEDVFAVPQHGNGVWAPNIRYHEGKVWIFYPDPDYGIYMIQTDDPKSGAWSEPLLILPGKGLIDPTPLWDDDGQAWLLHAWAKSRSGKNNILTLRRMSRDGTSVEKQGKVIINGHDLPGYRTLEGPKFYKRNGYYYIFAPAGGVPVGWQAVFRSKTIEGPYEYRTVLEQGDTLVNGPHQGAWVQTRSGEDWFFHFQSKLAYGRIVHLQPMRWVDDWPVIGSDPDGDGVGNPVSIHRKPRIGNGDVAEALSPAAPPTSDEFEQGQLGRQWQWNANPGEAWYSFGERSGYLRLYAQQASDPDSQNLWLTPSLLLQKLPAPNFIAEVTFDIPQSAGDISTGLVLFGEDYAWVGLKREQATGKTLLGYASCFNARTGCKEDFNVEKEIDSNTLKLRVTVADGGGAVFSYLDDNGRFKAMGELFQAKPGRWVGAKVGLFARFDGEGPVSKGNHIDVDSMRFYRPQ
jgi:beta-xylosidase